jgi:hypothetical protein
LRVLGSAQKIGAEFRNAMPAGGTIAAHRTRNESSAHSFQGRLMPSLHLKHDPEKWVPVFGKDHAQNKKLEREDDSSKSHPALAGRIHNGARDRGAAIDTEG